MIKSREKSEVFKYALLSVIILGCVMFLGETSKAFSLTALQPQKPEVVKLTKENSVVFRGVVTSESVTRAQIEAFDKASRLGSEDTLYLVLDTPGGSVDAGQMLVDSLLGLRPKVSTITLFAASMGFHTVQNLGERLITPNGVLMSHRVAIGGLSGQVPGEAVSRLNFILKESSAADELIAKRMGLSTQDYERLIYNEYWTSGEAAVKEHAADRVVLVKCEDSMVTSVSETSISTIFGEFKVSFSGCPLIKAPLAVSLSGEKTTESRKFIRELLRDKHAFVEDFIVNGKFNQIIK